MPGALARRPQRDGSAADGFSMPGEARIVGLWHYDIRHGLVFTDQAMAIAYGVDPVLAAQGMPPSVFRAAIHPDDLPGAIAALKRAIDDGTLYHTRYRVTHRDGSVSVVETHGHPLVRDGKTVSVTGANFDAASTADVRHSQPANPTSDLDDLGRHGLRSIGSTGASGAQLRTARRMMNWSVTKLSDESGVSCATINRLERYDGVSEPAAAVNAVIRLKATLEAQGVNFFLHSEGDGGVRWAR